MDAHSAPLPAAAMPANGLGRAAGHLDRALGGLVETVAAVLVLIEIIILGAGVMARYVFHAPLVWSDELASILFLWLSMLGAVVALRRGEHMRMTGLVSRVSPQMRALLEAVAITASIAFLLLIIPHALEYAEEENFIVTPALEISNAWRAAAIPVGVGLMLIAACCRLLRFSSLKPALLAIGLTALFVLLFWLAGPALKPLGKLNLIVFFVGVVALIFAPFTHLLPEHTRFVPVGRAVESVVASDASNSAVVMLAGSTELDLSALGAESGSREIEVWQLFGSNKIELPSTQAARVEVDMLGGTIRGGGSASQQNGVFLHHTVGSHPGISSDELVTVRVRVLFGSVRVEGGVQSDGSSSTESRIGMTTTQMEAAR